LERQEGIKSAKGRREQKFWKTMTEKPKKIVSGRTLGKTRGVDGSTRGILRV